MTLRCSWVNRAGLLTAPRSPVLSATACRETRTAANAPDHDPAAGAISSAPSPPGGPSLRFDGVYVGDEHEVEGDDGPTRYAEYLRFSAAGVAVNTPLMDPVTPDSTRSWFTPTYVDLPHGCYELGGTHLRFSMRSPDGVVDYDGSVRQDGLHLRSLSHINGYEEDEVYRFVPDSNAR